MLSRLAARRSPKGVAAVAGRRRPVPSSTAVGGPSPPIAAASIGEDALVASRHLRRAYSQRHTVRGGIVGASSSALRGGAATSHRDERECRPILTSATRPFETSAVYPSMPMQLSNRYFSASAFDAAAAAACAGRNNSLAHATLARPLRSSSSSALAGFNGRIGGGGGTRDRFYSENPLFMRTLDNVVRRAMSSSVPQPEPSTTGGEDTTKKTTTKMKSSSAASAAASATPPPHLFKSSFDEPLAKAATASAAKSTLSSSKAKKMLADPPTLLATATEFVQSLPGKGKDMSTAAAKAVAKVLAATPGVLWFYLTHPSEFRQKLLDLKEAAKKEAHHYWMGSKLLAADVRTARGLLNQTLRGSPLTRRERKQLLRTVTDVFRLVPMSIFVLVPFMEFALPVALKLFPNMLPSTFQDSLKAEENMKRELRSRIAMAEFFQETLRDLAKEKKKRATRKIEASDAAKRSASSGNESDTEGGGTGTGSDNSIYDQQETAASFLEFIEKARKGEMLQTDAIIKFASYFQDELTLDSMPRMQLVNMSKYMGLPPYGSDNFLRLQLRFKIRSLLEDDQRILWEGIDSLTKMELREACQERGMRSTGLSKEAYTRALQQWLDLSVNKNVPIALLIMSRTFFLQKESLTGSGGAQGDDDEESKQSLAGLADAISGLDKEVLNEVVLEVASAEEKVSNPEVVKIKLDVVEHQNELIAEEKQQRDEAAAAKKRQQEEEEKKSEAAAVAAAAGDVEVLEGAEAEKLEAGAAATTEIMPEPAKATGHAEPAEEPTRESSPAEVEAEEFAAAGGQERQEEEREQELSTDEMEALSYIASPDPVSMEREDLERLKAAMKEQEEDEEAEREEDNTIIASEDVIDVGVADDMKAAAGTEPEASKEEVSTGKATADSTPFVEPIILIDESDREAAETIARMDAAAKDEAAASTEITFETGGEQKVDGEVPAEEEEEEEARDERLDKAVDRLKSKVESMVGKIEVQMSDVQAKIGDKLHLLDKDRDEIISMEEMAEALQTVLKRKLTFEEAMGIAGDMDANKDGFLTVEELVKWVETNKLVKLVEEGRDGEVDRMIAKQASKMQEKQAEQEAEAQGFLEGESSRPSSKQ